VKRSVTDYVPVDLGPLRNAAEDIFAPRPSPGTGRTALRGIPFDLGGGASAYVARGGSYGLDSFRVAFAPGARTVIVAHALLATRFGEQQALGESVAEYVFEFADGTIEPVTIHELFEIAVVPETSSENRDVASVASYPFAALPDRYDFLLPRDGGPWEQAGRRLGESASGASPAFKLWTWRATDGRAPVALQVRPLGPCFVIGGITLGFVDEHPFALHGREPVLITSLDGTPLTVDTALRVDRGVATYVWPTQREDADAFVSSPIAGWGEPVPAERTVASADVAAVPSASIEVLAHGEPIGAVRWGDVLASGSASDGRVRIEWVDRSRTWVHTTVVDDATGRAVPCRIHFRSPSGIPWQPHGHHAHVSADLPSWHIDVGGDVRLGRLSYAVIDGRCQGWLPEGEVLVEVVRGFEYEPLRARLRIAPGQRELQLRIRRWTDLRADGWASGDTHVHFLSVDGAHIEASAEDLHVVNLLQSQWGSLFTNTEDFTGVPSSRSDNETIVFVGQENRQHLLGHLGLLGLRTPVMPWCSDGPNEAEIGGTLETTLSHWADAGRAAGALVTVPHFALPNGELPALIATGRVDALEMIRMASYFHEEYYRFLNAGYRLPLVGGTDKMSNEVPVGLYRTYARVGRDGALTFERWADAVRRGYTFLSAGPILRLRVEGFDIGDTVSLPRGGGSVEVEAVAESAAPIHTLQLVTGGRVVAEATDPRGTRRLALRERIPVTQSGWIAARAGGPTYYDARRAHDTWQRAIFAHTSPIYVACGEGPWSSEDPATLEYMTTRIAGMLRYIREVAPIADTGGHPHGEPDHRAYLERPFHEALAAIAERRARSGS
jgi:hypothetical protein